MQCVSLQKARLHVRNCCLQRGWLHRQSGCYVCRTVVFWRDFRFVQIRFGCITLSVLQASAVGLDFKDAFNASALKPSTDSCCIPPIAPSLPAPCRAKPSQPQPAPTNHPPREPINLSARPHPQPANHKPISNIQPQQAQPASTFLNHFQPSSTFTNLRQHSSTSVAPRT